MARTDAWIEAPPFRDDYELTLVEGETIARRDLVDAIEDESGKRSRPLERPDRLRADKRRPAQRARHQQWQAV